MNPESVGTQALVGAGTWGEEDARCYDRTEIPLRTAGQSVATQVHAADPNTTAKH